MLGLGTWRTAEDARRRDDQLRAIRLGIELGMTVIDTAEMYGDGDAEELVGPKAGTPEHVHRLPPADRTAAARDALITPA